MATKLGHVKTRYNARKHHAKKNNIPFDITLEYLFSIAVDTCPILKISLSWCEQSKKFNENSPTVDRIDPLKGYVVGNVAWISYRANRIKNNGTAEEHLAISNFMLTK